MNHGEGPVVHDPYTLPSDDNVNPYAFCVDLDGQWFLQKGKMIAYYGQIDFHGIGHGPLDHLVAANFHSPLHAAAWVVAQGRGKMLLADRAYDINSYDLEDGNLTIRSGNLLAFQPGLALKQSIIPGFLTLIGTGKFVAASNGAGALRGAADPGRPAGPRRLGRLPQSPATTTTTRYLRGVLGGIRALTGIGGASGEEHQFEFTGAGQVLLQSTEELMPAAETGGVPGSAGPACPAPGYRPYRLRAYRCVP